MFGIVTASAGAEASACASGDDEPAQGEGGSGGAAATADAGGGGGDAGTTTGSGGATTTTTTTVTSTGTGECQPQDAVVLAIDRIYFGDTNLDGTPSSTAWKQLGFDLDGVASTKDSTGLCQPNADGTKDKAYPDGDNGIDNSFGRNIIPLLLQTQPKFSSDVNASIVAGSFSIILSLQELGPGNDQAPIVAKLYGGSVTETQPAFDGTDCWPVVPELLEDPTDIASSKIVFADSALANATWSSGGTATVVLSIPLVGFTLTLRLYQARLSMDLSSDHTSAQQGRIGGVLDTEEFAEQVHMLAGTYNPVFCQGPIIDDILKQIRQSSDIMVDATQDPDAVCNGISFGLGFTMKQVQIGEIAPSSPPPTDPCPPQ